MTTNNTQQATIAVIDYGMGNLHSAKKALEASCKQRVVVTADAKELLAAQRVVLPGVGAIRDCMAALRARDLDKVIHELIISGKPLLGICIGMQLLLSFSEENDGVDCLNIFPEKVEFFSKFSAVKTAQLKVPHMGWNCVMQQPHALWADIPNNSYFYFVHSYCAALSESYSVGTCHYGINFSAAIAKDNLFAVQFHPEKSSDHGLQLLKNFGNWNPNS